MQRVQRKTPAGQSAAAMNKGPDPASESPG